jgi:colicin import membrane protein
VSTAAPGPGQFHPQEPSQRPLAPPVQKRPWFKKKRFAIPAGILAFVIVLGIVVPNSSDDEDTQSAPTASSGQPKSRVTPDSERETPSAEPTGPSAEEIAAQEEADRVAEEQAAADEAAQIEADRVAAEQAAAEQAAAAEAAAAEAAAAEAAAVAAAGTVSQQNALRSADNYLEFAAFSRTGLIDQLEFEGFSTEDATWGVDRVTVDWNEQAADSAKAYLEFSSFSHSGLVDQLVFEGFTAEQAEYGVSQTGL